ncbi:MAG: hypothetical protein A2X82_04300 [Geobacteraceae bacterium GWC2_55_20]|nr:MAG: hypothetical protein A2X82_04300 [Geobacteraceae bacterium GWC2_55_20]OGU24989.1 MAG: hypothetical protein A2X85_11555 [Geobacteraceae bacterium GWF2_54_21]
MILSAVLTLASGSFAAVPQEVGYQGYLTDAGGVPVNGSVTITLSLYTTSTGGTALWSENQTISIDKGIYSVSLGAVTPLTLPFDTRYYLGIKVGNDVELSPRQPLASTPYAYRAKWVDSHFHSATDITSGIIPNASISGIYSLALGLTNVGNVIYGNFYGNGANLTNLDASELTGTVPTTSLSGTYSQTLILTNTNNSFTGNGATLTSLNASNFTSGTIPDARLPLNVQKKYGKVAVVAQSGGDYTNPVTAMGAIASWCGTPSAANPCLLKIMPGVYNIGSTTLVMQQYVDLEGSGENVTTITGAVNSGSYPMSGVVNGHSAEIRMLTIKNIGPGTNVAALVNYYAYNAPKQSNVTCLASGGTNNYGIYNYASDPTLINVTATASGGTATFGIASYYSSPTMHNVIATAKDGTTNYGVQNGAESTPIMDHVTATASGGSYNYGVYNSYASTKMSNVTTTASGGTASYGIASYYSSPTMHNVIATAKDGTTNYGVRNGLESSTIMDHVTATANATAPNTICYGVYNDFSYPTMLNVTATASGTKYIYGVYNNDRSHPTMIDVTATAMNGTNSYGVYNKDSSASMSNVTASATYADSNIGMVNSITAGSLSTYTLLIDRSSFEGSNFSISNSAAAFTLKIGGSKLTGGPVNALGTYNCVGVYDGDTYTALGANCQ